MDGKLFFLRRETDDLAEVAGALRRIEQEVGDFGSGDAEPRPGIDVIRRSDIAWWARRWRDAAAERSSNLACFA
jgi:hypothetical protein